jgi:hypothetical protein
VARSLNIRVGNAVPEGVTLREVDGTADYYSQFSNPLPTTDYFPLGVWGSYDMTDPNIAIDQDHGINLYVWVDDNTEAAFTNVLEAGSYIFHSLELAQTYVNSATAGWMLIDEPDMTLQDGDDPWNGTVAWNTCTPIQDLGGKCGFTAMQTRTDLIPALDNRLKWANFGKDMIDWDPDSSGIEFLSYVDVACFDYYWYSDPHPYPEHISAPSTFPEAGNAIQNEEVRRASNYGYCVDKLRYLDGLSGSNPNQRMPIWGFVEVGNPWSGDQGGGDSRTIDPDEMRAAVWHCIIAEARGIVYFNHSFGGDPLTFNVIREPTGYETQKAELATTNALISSLADVLNGPFADDYVTTPAFVRTMAKYDEANAKFYVFAGNLDHTSRSATFTLAGGVGTNAVVLGESRSVSITGGQFTDTFSNGEAVHIYRID